MGLKDMINREIKITIGIVVIVSLVFIAMSYAIFKVDTTGSTDTIKFGDISLSFCKDSTCNSSISDIGNVIGTEIDSNGNTVYSKIYPVEDPVSESDWNNLKPYVFTLTNDGDIPLYISLYLEKDLTAGTIVSDGNEYSEFVDESEVKIAVAEGSSTPTISLYSDKADSDGNHKIASNILIKVGETKKFSLYAWLKSDASNSSQGKYFITQISARGEYLPSGSESDVDSNLKTVQVNVSDGSIDRNIKQVQAGNDVTFAINMESGKALSSVKVSCNGVTPTISGSTLTIKNVSKNVTCSVYETYRESYNLVDYIESTGTQFIDTGYVMTSSHEKVLIEYEKTNTSSSVSLFGAEKNGSNGSSNRTFSIIPHGTSSSTIYVGDSSSGAAIPSETNVRYSSVIEAKNLSVTTSTTKVSDGTTVTSSSAYTLNNGGAFTFVDHSINIFANHTSSANGDQKSSVKLYKFVLWDNGTLVRYYVPVIRKSDGVAGLYDIKNDVFYTNSGTGTFKTGKITN